MRRHLVDPGRRRVQAGSRRASQRGALTGKLVFLMGGHGWTYSGDYQTWYTQRGAGLGMVEDLANQDQMTLMAQALWNAGATVAPLRPIGHQTDERIIDDATQFVEFYGDWLKSDSPVSFRDWRGTPGYRFAKAAAEESAVARFRPNLARAGDYPVYGWVRDGADRIAQLYRVNHTGGVTEVRVNHRMVGKGWVWLGTYHFDAGTSGFVEISNAASDPYEADGAHVVVADAVRFGNGLGDTNKGGGISSHPREDEGNCYWIERSVGPAGDARIYSTDSGDGNATVMAPPRTSAFMNRESEGRYFDRLYLSFHSNAMSGKARGVAALWNKAPQQRPAFQEELARTMGRVFEDDMLSAPAVALPKYAVRRDPTSNWITFGELRKDYLQNEMCSTIMEVAFHDNPEDVALLMQPRVRIAMARATLKGILRWLGKVDPRAANLVMPPAPPSGATAKAGEAGRVVEFSWVAPDPNPMVGEAALGYRVYQSRDGRGFGSPVETDAGTTRVVVAESVTSGPLFARVVAFNSGGESAPSAVCGTFAPAGAAGLGRAGALVVDGFTSLDSSMDVPESAAGGLGSGLGGGGDFERIRPAQANPGNVVVAHADALTTLGVGFDSAAAARIGAPGGVALDGYSTVVWAAGGQLPADGVLSAAALRALSDFNAKGGRLFVSGSHVAESLARGGDAERRFLRETLGAEFVTTNGVIRRVVAAADGPLSASESFVLGDPASGGLSSAMPCDIVSPVSGGGAVTLGRFEMIDSGGVGVAVRGATGKAGGRVFLSVPFEAIGDAAARTEVMRLGWGFLVQRSGDAAAATARPGGATKANPAQVEKKAKRRR